jgi:quercetin dioxygenase-like cupin family protein
MPDHHAKRFSWSELPVDAPMALLERKRIVGEKAMISHILLRKGCSVPTHAHANEQFACVISGSLKFGLGEVGSPERKEMVVSAGEVLHLPAMVPHSADALEDTLVLDIFSPPSEYTGIDRGH